MTLFKSMSVMSAALLCATALFVSSCEDTTTLPTTFIPATPTSLKALSVNDSTIRIQFGASASEGATGFSGYKLSAVSGSSTVNYTIPKGAGSPSYVDLTGLAAGKTWTLSLKAVSSDSASEAISINWATATRYNGLKAYERSSSLGSGINLSLGTQQTVAAGGQWDVCFDSDNNAFGSPSLSAYVSGGKIGGSTPRTTYIFATDANTFYTPTADSLNQLYDSKSISDTTSSRKLKVEGLFGVTPSPKSFIVYVLTQDNNYAKMLLKSDGTSCIKSDANGKYVEIDASVQRTALIPYALRQSMGFDGPGIKATKILSVKHN